LGIRQGMIDDNVHPRSICSDAFVIKDVVRLLDKDEGLWSEVSSIYEGQYEFPKTVERLIGEERAFGVAYMAYLNNIYVGEADLPRSFGSTVAMKAGRTHRFTILES